MSKAVSAMVLIVIILFLGFILKSYVSDTFPVASTVVKVKETINDVKRKYEKEIKKLNEYNKKISGDYKKLIVERDFLERTIKKLKKENNDFRNRSSIVQKEMFE